MPRGQARRTGDVGGFRVPWGLVISGLFQIIALVVSAVTVYVGLSNQIVRLDERVTALKEANVKMEAQIDSVRRNSDGLEKYLIDLNRSVQSRVR